jgi:hypothetical protein
MEAPGQLAAAFLGDAAFWHAEVASTAPLTDDHPKRLTTLTGPPPADRYHFFSRIVSPAQTRAAFDRSKWLRELWPPSVHEAAPRYFAVQSAMNAFLNNGPSPVASIATIDRLLMTTDLYTLPLWMLGATDRVLEIARTSTRRDPTIAYARALEALAERRFEGAAVSFADAAEQGWEDTTARLLHAYALCRAGQVATARQLIGSTQISTAEADEFRKWLEERFGL